MEFQFIVDVQEMFRQLTEEFLMGNIDDSGESCQQHNHEGEESLVETKFLETP